MGELKSVVTFKWHSPGYRSLFTSEHVNTMRRMVERHYPRPLRFICVTDDPKGLDSAVEAVPLWRDYAGLANITWPDGPSCYRRLKVFAESFAEVAGERFLCIDLDAVITRDVSPLWDRPEPFVIWNPCNSRIRYCASMFMMDAGAMSQVWNEFRPERMAEAKAAGCRGSDQAWINYLVPKTAQWTWRDGVWSYGDQVMKGRGGLLPGNARIVVFCGKPDPWDVKARRWSPWIVKHYH